MGKNKQQVPRLRFPGFNDAWEQRKLNEISQKVTEKNVNNIYQETFTNSAEFGIINQRDFFDKDISNKANLAGYYVVQNNDFVYNPRISNFAPVGPIKRNKLGRNGVMSPLYYVFRVDSVDYQFLETYFENTQWHIFMKENGDNGARSDRFAIKDSVFSTMPILLPSQQEQTAIGKFFRQLDEAIASHQRKLERVKELKKSLLQKMFPKDGEAFPELRFPNFTDAWEQRKLGECGNTFTGLSGKSKFDFGHGSARYITYVNVLNNPIADKNIVGLVEIDDKQNQVKYGDCFFTTSSETPEEVGMSSVWLENTSNFYLNSFCFGYRPTTSFNPYYLAFMLRSDGFRKKVTFLAQGISRFNISKTKVMDLEIFIPSLKEQTTIGNFFRQLDAAIASHQRKP